MEVTAGRHSIERQVVTGAQLVAVDCERVHGIARVPLPKQSFSRTPVPVTLNDDHFSVPACPFALNAHERSAKIENQVVSLVTERPRDGDVML
jgi:hypothetical protein